MKLVYKLEFSSEYVLESQCKNCGSKISQNEIFDPLESLFCSDDCRYIMLYSANIVDVDIK